MIKRKPIRSSNLALRFYESEGWTEEELKSCLKQGSLIYQKDWLAGQNLSYWILDHNVGSQFDIGKLLERMSLLDRRFNDYPDETDEQFIRRMNW